MKFRVLIAVVVSSLTVVSGLVLLAVPAAACTNGPNRPPGGPGCGPSPVTVQIEIPTSASGVSLAKVDLNGTLYSNGSFLPTLISGYNYTFSVVNIASGYLLDHWADDNATIISANNQTARIVFCQSSLGVWFSCGTTTLALELAAEDHSLFSGQAFEATVVRSMAATFRVPSDTWYHLPTNGTNPPNGRYQIVDWGVGLGEVGGAPGVVAGLQTYYNSTKTLGQFNVTYALVLGPTTKTTAGQTRLTLSGGKVVAAGDSINVSLTGQNCSNPLIGLVKVQFLDLTNRGNASALGTCPGSTFPNYGAWIVWDPKNGSGILSPNYRSGLFTNLTFNGQLLYPHLQVSPPFGCQLLAPPYINWCPAPTVGPVNFIQWAQAASGWNESLYPGLVTFSTGTPAGAFYPFVATLDNVLVDIYPKYFGNSSRELELVVNGQFIPDGVVTLLQYGALATLNVSGDHSGIGFTQAFIKWGTNSGTVSNTSRQSTTLNVSQPGRLEALIQMVGSLSTLLPDTSGYSNSSLAGMNNLTAEFLFPNTTFNASTANAGQAEVLQIGVAMTSMFEDWIAGLQIRYSSATSMQVSTFYELTGHTGTFGSGYFVASPGNRVMVNITSANTTACGPRQQFCWTISNLDHTNLSNQTGPSHQFEEWIGGTPTSGSIAFGADWWFAGTPDPNMIACPPSNCGTPKLVHPLDFTNLEVDGKATALFGPYEVTFAIFQAPTGLTEKLLTNVVCSPTGYSFTITQG